MTCANAMYYWQLLEDLRALLCSGHDVNPRVVQMNVFGLYG